MNPHPVPEAFRRLFELYRAGVLSGDELLVKTQRLFPDYLDRVQRVLALAG